jgi:hypothetical protein
MPSAQKLDTHHKALTLNLDPSTFGSFAEIGAGQEVARWFLLVGGASGTVAKSISAYDKEVSDDLCPASSILSGQRQLDFPMLFEIPAAVGAVGKVGIPRVLRDFQGRWEGRKTCFWVFLAFHGPAFSTAQRLPRFCR